MTGIAAYYRQAQRSFVDMFQPLDDEQLATPVQCTPGWTVRDVLSHVAGVTDDIVNGRLDGSGTDPWTAAQIERWRDADTTVLIEQWNGQVSGVADLLEEVGEVRPPIDCHSHEHDVRHTLGLIDNQESELIEWMAQQIQTIPGGRPVSIVFDDGTTGALSGEGAPIELADVSKFEFVRSRLGRRTRQQVAAYGWSEPPDDELITAWFGFGPAEQAIVEAASKWG